MFEVIFIVGFLSRLHAQATVRQHNNRPVSQILSVNLFSRFRRLSFTFRKSRV